MFHSLLDKECTHCFQNPCRCVKVPVSNVSQMTFRQCKRCNYILNAVGKCKCKKPLLNLPRVTYSNGGKTVHYHGEVFGVARTGTGNTIEEAYKDYLERVNGNR